MIVIGLSTNKDSKTQADTMPKDYVKAVLRAGALPVILPMIQEDDPNYDEFMDKIINMVDGIVFTGGPDLEPTFYKEARLPGCQEPLADRDKADLALISRALSVHKPFLGICRGMQVCNVITGGSLYQDLPTQRPEVNNHDLPDRLEAHQVTIAEGSLLNRVTKATQMPVTSRHHQAVKQLGHGLRAVAFSEEGIIEAVEFEDGRPALCVQWHPENLSGTDKRHQALFDWLVRAAEERK
ncbi:MAG: gamma-glutamyl-gamma-aminobutyrate hydrolase family protein [Clostridiales bacterium]|nr:gamma-glutamyl-gamma-aminobutyrate hydrolase family protein [Clostridiales bacterium]